MSRVCVSIVWVTGLVLSDKQVPAEPQRVDLHKNIIWSRFWEVFGYSFGYCLLSCLVLWFMIDKRGSISQQREGSCLQCLSWAHPQGRRSWPLSNLTTSESRHFRTETRIFSQMKGFEFTLTLDFTKHAFVVSLLKTKTEHSSLNYTGRWTVLSWTCYWKHPLADWSPTGSWLVLHPAFLCSVGHRGS